MFLMPQEVILRHLGRCFGRSRRVPKRISANFEWLIQVFLHPYIRTSSRRRELLFLSTTTPRFFITRVPVPSSFLPCSFQAFFNQYNQFIMSSFQVVRQHSKRKGDLADSFPIVGRCLKCFKNLIIDPFTLCSTAPGKKNCDRCNKQSESCELVRSFLVFFFLKNTLFLTRFSDPPFSFGGLPVLGRYRHDLQAFP